MNEDHEGYQYFHILYFDNQQVANEAQAQVKQSHDKSAWQDTDHVFSQGNPTVKFVTDRRLLSQERYDLEKQVNATRGVFNDQW